MLCHRARNTAFAGDIDITIEAGSTTAITGAEEVTTIINGDIMDRMIIVKTACPNLSITTSCTSPVDNVDASSVGTGEAAPENGVCSLHDVAQMVNASGGDASMVLPVGTYLLPLGENSSLTGDIDIALAAGSTLTISGAGEATTMIGGADSDRMITGRTSCANLSITTSCTNVL